MSSTDDEKDPPVPADLEGKMPRKVHRDQAADGQDPSNNGKQSNNHDD